MKSRCSCGAVYTIKPEFLGKRTLCKHCGQSFVIAALPSDSGAALAGPPELEPSALAESASPEIEPVQAADSGPESDVRPLEVKAGRPFLALAVAALAGTLVGAGLMGLARQGEIDGLKERLARLELQDQNQARQKLGVLKEELDRLQDDVRLLEGADYPAGSIPQTLAEAAVLEYKTAEALIRQQVAALESGAGLTVTAKGTAPDPELAAAVEEEMARLEARLEGLRREAEGRAEEPLSMVQTAIATEELNLAILNRNRLIARYGLSAPLPPRRPAGAGE